MECPGGLMVKTHIVYLQCSLFDSCRGLLFHFSLTFCLLSLFSTVKKILKWSESRMKSLKNQLQWGPLIFTPTTYWITFDCCCHFCYPSVFFSVEVWSLSSYFIWISLCLLNQHFKAFIHLESSKLSLWASCEQIYFLGDFAEIALLSVLLNPNHTGPVYQLST